MKTLSLVESCRVSYGGSLSSKQIVKVVEGGPGSGIKGHPSEATYAAHAATADASPVSSVGSALKASHTAVAAVDSGDSASAARATKDGAFGDVKEDETGGGIGSRTKLSKAPYKRPAGYL